MSFAALSPARGQIRVDLRHFGGDRGCCGRIIVAVAVVWKFCELELFGLWVIALASAKLPLGDDGPARLPHHLVRLRDGVKRA